MVAKEGKGHKKVTTYGERLLHEKRHSEERRKNSDKCMAEWVQQNEIEWKGMGRMK